MTRRAWLAALGLAVAACSDTTITPETAPAAAPTTAAAVVPFVSVVTTRPATTTPPVTEGPFGTTFTVTPGDRKITAYALKVPVPPASTSSFSQPGAGMVFAAADVQECAGPAGEKFSPNRFDFELALSDNTRIRAGVEVQAPQLASSPLLPGDCIRGWVSFEVPAASTIRQVVYSTGSASAKWRVT